MGFGNVSILRQLNEEQIVLVENFEHINKRGFKPAISKIRFSQSDSL